VAFFKSKDLQARLGSFGRFVGRKIGSALGRQTSAGPDSSEIGSEKQNFLQYEKWISVSSSNVAMAKYDVVAAELYIEFNNGATYAYSHVSSREAESFYDAGSKGKWVWDYLRVRGPQGANEAGKLPHKKPYRMTSIGEYVSKRIKFENPPIESEPIQP